MTKRLPHILFALFFLFGVTLNVRAQIITTFAGNGIGGYSGDGGPATAAQIDNPNAVALDGLGGFFVSCELGYGLIRNVNAAGTINTYAGTGTVGFSGDGGPATAAMIYSIAVTADSGGNLYILDYGSNRVRKVDATTGIITTIAGNGSTGYTGDGGPATAAALVFSGSWWYGRGFASDPAGNIYIYMWGYFKIRRIDASTGIITTICGTGSIGYTGDGGAATAAQLGYSYGLAVDGYGNVFIADYTYQRIRMINSSGIINTIAGTGVGGFSGDGGPATAAQLGGPTGVAVDGAGYISLCSSSYHSIRKINTSGIITTIAGTGTAGFGGDGGPATAASLSYPLGLAADAPGNLYICDYHNIRVRKINNHNSPPNFTLGAFANLIVCQNSVGDSFNSLLPVMDSDVYQLETWRLLSAPSHGAVSVAWSTASTGLVVISHGCSYTPATGYSGLDTFKVAVNDGYVSDTIAIYVNVIASPSIITGFSSLCIGASGIYTDAVSSGTWSSGFPAIATIGSATGLVTGVTTGTAIITYTLSTGCYVTKTVTVNPAPGLIAGTSNLCIGVSSALSDATTGGIWSSSNPSIAGIGSSAGIISGVSMGTATITYTLPTGCLRTFSITVNPNPAPITGTTNVCAASTVSLSDATAGGTWGTFSTILSVGSITGTVTGISAGAALVSYTAAGCSITAMVTVNPSPLPITGIFSVCMGITMSLFDSGGGVWSSTVPTIATIGSTSGIVTGMSAGTSTISYTFSDGCTATKDLTIDPNPPAITGYMHVCPGLITILSDTLAGGYWTSNDITIATVDIGSGVVTGIIVGTVIISYNLSTGCFATSTLTVNSTPTAITGVSVVCIGSDTTLYNGVSGGIWSSGNPVVATINASTGIYHGVSVGSAVMTYSLGAGCNATFTISVNPAPAAITGTLHVCPATSTTLSDATTGGTWSTSSGIFSIGATTGTLSGITAGTAVVSYTAAGCSTTATVTVNPLPGPITGTMHVCPAGSTGLAATGGGGTWLSGNTAIATIGSLSGLVIGVSAGIAPITYTLPTGCSTRTTITVNPNPTSILGPATVCIGSTITLSDGSTGGVWSKSNANVNIGTGTGVVTGVNAGTTIITYAIPTGCYAIKTITINPSPGTITGVTHVCVGGTTTLSCAGSGTWTTSSGGIASVGSLTGIVTGIYPGTAVINYTVGSGCLSATTVTVDALPSVFTVTGGGSICAGSAGLHIGLSGSVSGVSYQLYIGGVAAGGILTGGGGLLDFGTQSVAGMYTVVATSSSSLCTANMTGTATIAVNPLPLHISGATAVCVGAIVTETDAGGGTWISSTPAIATIGSSTGIVTGMALGSTIITYTLPTSCYITTTVNVSTSPTAISGISNICAGTTTTLTDGVSGGLWGSPAYGAVVSVGSTSGIVTGVAAGTAIITYSLGTGCTVTRSMTVTAAPAAITGTMSLCAGGTSTLHDATIGGTWSPSTGGIATVGSTSGIVSGISAGISLITYTAVGCYATAIVTVNPVPAGIAGPSSVCAGATVTETDATTGGMWSTTAATISIGAASGVVIGISAGTAVVSYSVGGCVATRTIAVNALPTISGASGVCAGSSTTLTTGTGGGVWTSGNTVIVTVGSVSGVVAGVSGGTTNITYTLPTGCYATKSVTVSAGPATITGTASVCVGATTVLSDGAGGGVWTSGSTGVATIGSLSGIVTGVNAGTSTIVYSLGSGCTVTKVVTVNALPSPITGTGSVCVGATTTLSDAVAGGVWTSGSANATVGSATGMVTGIAAGTATITYTSGSAGSLPGCSVTRIVTVNAPPSAITGVAAICVGTAATMSDSTTGGSWSSSNPIIATVGSGTGLVTGVNTGSATITYTSGTGCLVTKAVTVNPPVASITGPNHVCAGATITLSDPATGGTWSSSSIAIATVGTGTGLVTGVSGGSVVISYSPGSSSLSGCYATYVITVNAVPPVTGLTNLCAWGDTVTIHDANPAGSYSSTLVTIVNLGGGDGRVIANAPGVGNITYTLTSGCSLTRSITVNPLPGPITGIRNLCVGASVTLSDTAVGGVWSGSTAIATIGSGSGVVTGIAAGTTPISYTLPTGCKITISVTVDPVPTYITGWSSYVIVGTSSAYADATPGGVWSSSNMAVATVGSGTGIVRGVTPGVITLSYTVVSSSLYGCAATRELTVIPLPGVHPVGYGNGDLQVIPNPNTGTFGISGTLGASLFYNDAKDEEVIIEVTDMVGKVVYRDQFIANSGHINTEVVLENSPASGVYLLNIKSERERKVFRVVVER